MKFTSKYRPLGFLSAMAVFAFASIISGPAFATDANDVAENIVDSIDKLPQLIAVAAYLIGLIFGFWGIIKAKEHVENPGNTPLSASIIRFAIGGALFSTPMMYEIMMTTINGGSGPTSGEWDDFFGPLSSLFGVSSIVSVVTGLGMNFGSILQNMVASIDHIPTLLSVGGYILGALMGVWGFIKLKEHVENPQNTPLREGLIRIFTGGALFALPTIMVAMKNLISGGSAGGIITAIAYGDTAVSGISTCGSSAVTSTVSTAAAAVSSAASSVASVASSIGLSSVASSASSVASSASSYITAPRISDVLCNIVFATLSFPMFLGALAYIAGIILALWGLLKLRDHVLNPQQTPLWDAGVRFVAGGALFALPTILDMAIMTAIGPLSGASGLVFSSFTTFTGTGATTGLDGMLIGLMGNSFEPMRLLLKWFSFVAGIMFILVGISRLLKSSQEGPRGPGGIGTIMTFLVGGMLLSVDSLLTVFSTSLFNNPTTAVGSSLGYATGLSPTEQAHIHGVISAILQFMIVLGFVSFIRGFFIIRGVAEGNSQASMMAGITHLLGGALAVNLGPLLNTVQSTLGLSGFGVQFS